MRPRKRPDDVTEPKGIHPSSPQQGGTRSLEACSTSMAAGSLVNFLTRPHCSSCHFSLSLSLSLFLSPGLWCRGVVPLHRARRRPRLLWDEEVTRRPSAAAALFANCSPQQLESEWEKARRHMRYYCKGVMTIRSCCCSATGFPRAWSGLWSLGKFATLSLSLSFSAQPRGTVSLSLSLCLCLCLCLSLCLSLSLSLSVCLSLTHSLYAFCDRGYVAAPSAHPHEVNLRYLSAQWDLQTE